MPINLRCVLARVNRLICPITNHFHVTFLVVTALFSAERQSVLYVILGVMSRGRVARAKGIKRYHAHGATF